MVDGNISIIIFATFWLTELDCGPFWAEKLNIHVNVAASNINNIIQNKIIFSRNMITYDGYRYIKEK